jgi:meso-butanediol dehydrogenase/(S,S)-butanediol dehydrogenase/diacetyl reductase
MDTSRLAGKHVLITGAAKGMGAAVAEHLAAQGAKVCLGDIDVDRVKATAGRIVAAGGVAVAVKLDVRRRDDMRAAVAKTVEAFGSINVMLNNAGINWPIAFLDIKEDEWRGFMDVNALGALIGMQEAAKQMIKQEPQNYPYKIINVGSIASRQALDEVIAYSASKHAVLALINGGAKVLAKHRITVNGYGPGAVMTDMWDQIDEGVVKLGLSAGAGELAKHLAENVIRLGRMSVPQDVVGTAAFLASPDSDYMTGQLLIVDGGIVMQ